jgi:hypothetical protein
MITLLPVDDDTLLRLGLPGWLKKASGISVAGQPAWVPEP